MKKLFAILFVVSVLLASCSVGENLQQNTLFFFYPWSTNLTHYFEYNIATFENALTANDLKENRIVVFVSNFVSFKL